ncbi:YdcF family protein [Kineococcus terrestris]|uniref:YdcF family protein n=1 Tax=Kineococcus terrestris TaxID=2044856 RepID=UPI0034DAEBD9
MSRSLRSFLPAALASSAALPVVVVLVAELAQWHASRCDWPRDPGCGARPVPGPHVVLVLGCPSRPGGRLHALQRWRTDIAVRSMHPEHGRLLFTGGRTGAPGEPSEARVMACYAQEALGVPAQRIEVEEAARSTWQNVQHCLDRLEQAGSITIASTATHARRARGYLAQQRPDLAQRLVPADDYHFGERCGWKVTTLAHALARTARRAIDGAALLGSTGARTGDGTAAAAEFQTGRPGGGARLRW